MVQRSRRFATLSQVKAKSERSPNPNVETSEKPAEDVVLIRGVSEDGNALAVLRARQNRVEAGIVRGLREGEPVTGELVRLKPRPDCPLLCDVEVELPAGTVNAGGGSDRPAPRKLSHGGPPQVATAKYRDNWDAIWNKSGTKKALPN